MHYRVKSKLLNRSLIYAMKLATFHSEDWGGQSFKVLFLNPTKLL